MTEILIAGGGPSGLALAAGCRARGLTVRLADPRLGRPWQATYGMWAAQWDAACAALPVLRRVAVRRTENPALIAPTPHAGRRVRGNVPTSYVVCDTASLQEVLWEAAQPMTTSPATWTTADLLSAASTPGPGGPTRVVDARGAIPGDLRSGGRWTPGSTPVQSAFGIALDDAALAPLLEGDDGILMDWRRAPTPHDEPARFHDVPSFLYVVRLPGGTTLAEETDLAGAPALPISVLSRRLDTRLESSGVATTAVRGREKVHFPLVAASRPRGLECFGAAAGFGHPATGYSVATSLAAAAPAAAALATGRPLPRPMPRATAVAHAMGLAALLELPGPHTVEMFAAFAGLDGRRQQAFFERTTGPARTVAAMAEQWWHTPWATRRAVIAAVARGVSRSPGRRRLGARW